MNNVLKLLTKSVLTPLVLTAAATNAAIQKKIFGSSMRPSDSAKHTTLIILNEEMDDIMKINKSLEQSGLLMKGVSETIQYEAKEQKGEFFNMLFGQSLDGI